MPAASDRSGLQGLFIVRERPSRSRGGAGGDRGPWRRRAGAAGAVEAAREPVPALLPGWEAVVNPVPLNWTLRPVRAEERPLLDNLIQRYRHDFCDYYLDDVDESGRFGFPW